ncbi:hypothetical protein [Candidatus Nanohalococcus occultus]|uniref:Uncharacterized protein n=1 Tax=Candidatus Nanohalococcus occultus TaxID=2978047 RepID=A0ABY8CGJ4_9ARCH|nr:hypothetical protein SVXNc_0843 [Candidatus Nanohaloarchaeota archaeon SVXNc]
MHCESAVGWVNSSEVGPNGQYKLGEAPEKPGYLHIPATQFISGEGGHYIKMCDNDAVVEPMPNASQMT